MIINNITRNIHDEITKFKQVKLENECNKLASMNANESKFWAALKKLENNNQKQQSIPYLHSNNVKIFNDKDKAELFAKALEEIFTPYSDDQFNNQHKKVVENFVKSENLFNYESNNTFDKEFVINELEIVLKSIKPKAKGPNPIANSILKNLEHNGKLFLLNMLNNSFLNNRIPNEWKYAKITMIPKKPNDSHNIKNYRPISLTNTIVKILEKLIKNRLVSYLEQNNIFIKEQSGFRTKKRTIDNIFFFKQKCQEAFYSKAKVGNILFDIEKAFDKVWHDGLLFKMHELKIPPRIANWIKNFISNRIFAVNVNGKLSKEYPIKTGVPQGAILSPILFLIFINDIPTTISRYKYVSHSLLFADDLSHFSFDHNIKYLQKKLQHYLDLLEQWLFNWRLKTATNKCTYNIYTENGKCEDEMQLKLFGSNLNKEDNAKYLGIHLDHNMNMGYHIKQMKTKCMRKLNFLKILKSKKWATNIQTKVRVYNSMIRSNIDYAAPLLVDVSETNKKTIESIQYHGMLQISNKSKGSSHTEMRKELKMKSINDRNKELKLKYTANSIQHNPLIKDLYTEHKKFKVNNKIENNNFSIFNTS